MTHESTFFGLIVRTELVAVESDEDVFRDIRQIPLTVLKDRLPSRPLHKFPNVFIEVDDRL
jgi:hypothetical protein